MSSHCLSITISHNSDYLNLGHMTETAESHILNDGYYLSHHAMMKTTSLTTKLRVVFDGSAATTSGTALNDTLLTGPKSKMIFSLLQGLAEENLNKRLQLGESSTIKTLGVVWNSSDDSISYAVTTFKSIGTITKRSISSEIAKIYDLLGLLSSVIIVAKILLQKLCTMIVDWDESLPIEIHTEWIQYYHRLPLLNGVVFQRKTIATGAKELELHVAKSKVAPLKTQSIPCLELCGAFLLSSLYQTVREALQLPIKHTTFWTDSTIVLHWLQTSSIVPEQKTAICLATMLSDISFLERYSSWTKMQRVIAYCLRWKSSNKEKGALSALELKNSRVCDTIIQLLQRVYFAEEIRCLTKNQTVKGKLQQLNPFLDDDRMLRVGGRLKHSPMPFNQKHPLILPKARITSVIIESEHRAQLHAGVQTTLYAIRRRYWPIDGRSQIWKAIKGCVTCCQAQPPPTNYIMGNLPPSRVTESRPFSNAPHFGGLWEAAVKSFKYHLKRVAGNELFTFENFNTLITEIEAILNSRPLSPISSDANDLLASIPGHFLIGDSLTSLRERDFRVTPSNRLSSWQQIQKIKQHFWNWWRREYLNELTCRHKWATGSHPIKEGTIVLLREDNTPSLQWPLGKVVKIHPGSNGIIRAATVKTATKVLDRSIKRLVPLPNQTDDSGSETAEMKDIPNLIGPTKKQTSESRH
ncbi:uncharacterized protein LOC143262574 [Megalopta genalis]|uniref:uncharacterized protein LOC143262574 n=1 Tax=Megalopta genalis TaxID=115081 RepID=UPI003FD5C5CB